MENALKESKKQQAEYEAQLVELMEQEDLQSFTTENGQKISRRDTLFVSARVEDRLRWFEWLTSIKRSDLIKTDVNKTSLNALIRKIVKGDENYPMPEFLDMEHDIFFKKKVEIKLGNKSLRRAASDAGANADNGGEF